MKIQSSYCNFENIFIAKIASKFVYKGRVAIWSLPPSPPGKPKICFLSKYVDYYSVTGIHKIIDKALNSNKI